MSKLVTICALLAGLVTPALSAESRSFNGTWSVELVTESGVWPMRDRGWIGRGRGTGSEAILVSAYWTLQPRPQSQPRVPSPPSPSWEPTYVLGAAAAGGGGSTIPELRT